MLSFLRGHASDWVKWGRNMNLDDREERQVAAAEFLLDRLSPRERDAFEDRLVDDPSLRDLVEQWRIRLENRNAPPSASSPPLERDGRGRRPWWPSRRKQPAEPAVRHLRRRLDAWQMIAAAGIVTTAALAYFLFARPPILDASGEAAPGAATTTLPLDATTGTPRTVAPGAEEGATR